ncbi:hypothetical protein, partial [Pseudomonas viridiflava]|uniref:hypothetical protein n=1 Tax=Pseudomonas viridiflava TaxID=33069 RepID=UPI001C1276BF
PASRLPQQRVQSADYVLFDKSGLVREYCISDDEYSSDVMAFADKSAPTELLRDRATSKT